MLLPILDNKWTVGLVFALDVSTTFSLTCLLCSLLWMILVVLECSPFYTLRLSKEWILFVKCTVVLRFVTLCCTFTWNPNKYMHLWYKNACRKSLLSVFCELTEHRTSVLKKPWQGLLLPFIPRQGSKVTCGLRCLQLMVCFRGCLFCCGFGCLHTPRPYGETLLSEKQQQ